MDSGWLWAGARTVTTSQERLSSGAGVSRHCQVDKGPQEGWDRVLGRRPLVLAPYSALGEDLSLQPLWGEHVRWGAHLEFTRHVPVLSRVGVTAVGTAL